MLPIIRKEIDEYKNKILEGNALEQLRLLPHESVDTIITSPPYWSLRDYKTDPIVWDNNNGCDHEFKTIRVPKPNSQGGKTPTLKRKYTDNYQASTEYDDRAYYSSYCIKCNSWKGQLGQEPKIDEYIDHLILIFNQCRRVLKSSGSCFVVMGDTYASGGGLHNEQGFRRKKNIETYAEMDYPVKSKLRAKNDKSLLLIPERFALKMFNYGWILRNKIIWHKPNCMPSSAKDRFTNDYEYIYFFTKTQNYYFNTQYERYTKPLNRWGGKIHNVPKSSTKGNEAAMRYKDGKDCRPNEEGRIKRTVWTINLESFSDDHYAIYPQNLVYQILKATCPISGTILDPFMGSGTTALVSLKNNRNFIGIDNNPKYIKMALKRIDPYLKQNKLTQYLF